MKRYSFIIALLSFVFLGLGNISFAVDCSQCQSLCTSMGQSNNQGCLDQCNNSCTNTNNGPSTILTCTSSNLTSAQQRNCTCFQTVNGVITDANVGDVNTKSGGGCCTQNTGSVGSLSTCTTNELNGAASGAPCSPPNNGKINSVGICSCPTGTKNINGTCTSCKAPGVCCGISLNTSVPFIGNCIEDNSANKGPGETNVTGETAFPVLVSSLTKILVTAILIISFVLIIIGGIMISTGNPSGGKSMIIKVVVGIALLGASGVILRLINPNFFG